MTDVKTIGNSPIAPYNSCMLPKITSYTGYYPAAIVTLPGSRSGDRANSYLTAVWQKSYAVPPNGQYDSDETKIAPWASLTAPGPVTVTIQLRQPAYRCRA